MLNVGTTFQGVNIQIQVYDEDISDINQAPDEVDEYIFDFQDQPGANPRLMVAQGDRTLNKTRSSSYAFLNYIPLLVTCTGNMKPNDFHSIIYSISIFIYKKFYRTRWIRGGGDCRVRKKINLNKIINF